MKLTIKDVFDDHARRVAEDTKRYVNGEISAMERIHLLIVENEISEVLLKRYREEQQ